MNKWYLQSWLICLVFAFSFLIFPFFIGLVLLFLQYKESKKLKNRYASYSNIEDAEMHIANMKQEAEKQVEELKSSCEALKQSLKYLKADKRILETDIDALEREVFHGTVSIQVDDNITSEEYKNKLVMLRSRQSDAIKNLTPSQIPADRDKKTYIADLKQIMRCFNSEAAAIIASVSVKNIDAQRNKLQKSFEALNKLFLTDGVSISPEYLQMRLEELTLIYQYELKKEQEREQQKAIKEQMIEEEKVRREIEREKAKIEKEEAQFKSEISKLMSYLQKASDAEKQLYIDKIRELEDKLKLVEKDKENVLEREQNTRAGYVYVISNIGSFGEGVYKIGMTRRLEPMDRVRELGDASVPFEFDVHAMIFSTDAPALEAVLHKTFRQQEVNKVNTRKEFFRVPLQQIERVVKEEHNATVTFTHVAAAQQYRESLRMSESA